MDKIKWAICDDDKYLTYIYENELKKFEDLEYVGNTFTASEFPTFVEKNRPDVVLLDIQMETSTAGIDIIPELKLLYDVKVIMLTSFDYDDYIFQAFANGACDFLTKNSPKEEMHQAIVDAYNNRSTLKAEMAQIIAKRTSDIESKQRSILYVLEIMTRLSQTEFEILKAIYMGNSYQKIADDRFVDVITVRTHASRIIKKFGKSNMKAIIDELKDLSVMEFFNQNQ